MTSYLSVSDSLMMNHDEMSEMINRGASVEHHSQVRSWTLRKMVSIMMPSANFYFK